MVIAGLLSVNSHDVLVRIETEGRYRRTPGLECMGIRRVLAIAPAYEEMEIRFVARECAATAQNSTAAVNQRHHTLRFDRIIDVRDPAQKVFAICQDPLDVDDRAVSRIATYVRNQVPGVIELRVDALGALPPVAFDVADQRAGTIVARCLARDDLRDYAGSAAWLTRRIASVNSSNIFAY